MNGPGLVLKEKLSRRVRWLFIWAVFVLFGFYLLYQPDGGLRNLGIIVLVCDGIASFFLLRSRILLSADTSGITVSRPFRRKITVQWAEVQKISSNTQIRLGDNLALPYLEISLSSAPPLRIPIYKYLSYLSRSPGTLFLSKRYRERLSAETDNLIKQIEAFRPI